MTIKYMALPVPVFIKQKSAHQHRVQISCTKLDNKCVMDG
jgi:hypothetical protein